MEKFIHSCIYSVKKNCTQFNQVKPVFFLTKHRIASLFYKLRNKNSNNIYLLIV